MAHREHQINLAAARQVDAGLEIGLAHVAEQVGPVGQGGVAVEIERDQLLHRRQQAPSTTGCGRAGHLNLGAECLGYSRRCGQRLELGCHAAWNQKQNAHGRRRSVG